MSTKVSNNFRIKGINVYRPGCLQPERLLGDWTIQELSMTYPVSVMTGIDSLMLGAANWQQNGSTVEFIDSNDRVLPHDPRVFIEDLDLVTGG